MTTNNENNNSVYRGRCDALKSINEVAIDIAALVAEYPSELSGEPARKVFPVRSQLTWFRLKNGKGRIVSELIKDDEFVAIVKATVFVDGEQVANAHGSADVTNDGVRGFKLIETAESRAISRALDFAGYGCQLDLKTFDDFQTTEPEEPKPAPNQAPPANDVCKAKEVPSAPQAGFAKGKKRIDANVGSLIVDIKDLASLNKAPEQEAAIPQKKTQGEEEQLPIAVPDPASKEEIAKAASNPESKEEIVKTASNPESKEEIAKAASNPEPTEETLKPAPDPESKGETVKTDTTSHPCPIEDSVKNIAEQSQASPSVAETPKDSTEETSDRFSAAPSDGTQAMPEEKANTQAPQNATETQKTGTQLVFEYIHEANRNNITPAFDARFFGNGAVDPNALYFNPHTADGGKQTKMNNRELQLALSFLQAHPEVINDLYYPTNKGAFVGKTFGDIFAGDTEIAAMAVDCCKRLYSGKDVSAYAAALILAAKAKQK